MKRLVEGLLRDAVGPFASLIPAGLAREAHLLIEVSADEGLGSCGSASQYSASDVLLNGCLMRRALRRCAPGVRTALLAVWTAGLSQHWAGALDSTAFVYIRGSTASPWGALMGVCMDGPPSPGAAYVPDGTPPATPATVEMAPSRVTLRIIEFPVSAMNRFPEASRAALVGA